MRPHVTRHVKHVAVVLFCLSILCTALLATVATAPVVEAGCSGSECYDCIARVCQLSEIGGHCACESGGTVGGGQFCVAGGGVCYIVP